MILVQHVESLLELYRIFVIFSKSSITTIVWESVLAKVEQLRGQQVPFYLYDMQDRFAHEPSANDARLLTRDVVRRLTSIDAARDAMHRILTAGAVCAAECLQHSDHMWLSRDASHSVINFSARIHIVFECVGDAHGGVRKLVLVYAPHDNVPTICHQMMVFVGDALSLHVLFDDETGITDLVPFLNTAADAVPLTRCAHLIEGVIDPSPMTRIMEGIIESRPIFDMSRRVVHENRVVAHHRQLFSADAATLPYDMVNVDAGTCLRFTLRSTRSTVPPAPTM